MKTIKQLRTVLDFYPQEINSQVSHFAKHSNIDFEVFLPSVNKNLQRDFVWTINQKRELIWSMLMKRNIPRISMVNTVDNVYQIIDGKQRLSSMIDFYNNKYTLLIDGKEYLFKELPKDYQTSIGGYFFGYMIINEDYNKQITDKQKINWFRFINFAGTPQDAEHFQSLTKQQ